MTPPSAEMSDRIWNRCAICDHSPHEHTLTEGCVERVPIGDGLGYCGCKVYLAPVTADDEFRARREPE